MSHVLPARAQPSPQRAFHPRSPQTPAARCSIAAPHLDPLVIKAIKFLTSAVAKAQHAAVFGDPATLRAALAASLPKPPSV